MPVHPRRAARTSIRWPVILVVAVAAVALGLAVDVSDDGRVHIPWPGGGVVFQLFGEGESTPDREGMIAVPMSARRIPAYAEVKREDLWDAAAGTLKVAWLSPSTVEGAGILTTISDVRGRVLAKEKPQGYVFTERDFLPRGTRPGLVAGIPVGKRALRVEIGKIDGLVGLSPGDHFDLLATVPLDQNVGIPDDMFTGPFASQMRLQASLGNLSKQASVKLLVDNGMVVSPLENRMVPVTSTSLTGGTTTRTRPVQEMVIAISPEEVPRVVESLGLELKLLCLPRSGRPEESDGGVTPSTDPSFPFWGSMGEGEGSMSLIETIDGDQRALRPVPRSEG